MRTTVASGHSARPRRRPTLAQLGGHRLARVLVALNLAAGLLDVVLFRATGLTIAGQSFGLLILLLGLTGLVWGIFLTQPSTPGEWIICERLTVCTLVAGLLHSAGALQYGAVAVGAPFVDRWLANGDAALGVSVPALAAWTAAHPAVNTLLTRAYFTFLPQMLGVFALLLVTRDGARLWEFVWHLHVALFVTVAALLVWPARCPPAYYGFVPTIDMTHVIGQIQGLHDGTLRVLTAGDLDGLVSVPSFHVAGVLIVCWTVRDRRWLLVPLLALNGALVASTVLTGVHYAVDVLAAAPLVAGSVWLYRRAGLQPAAAR